MVTVNKVITIRNGKEVIEGTCVSGDAKPAKYGNGSILMEMDTAKMYLYDEIGKIWRAWE